MTKMVINAKVKHTQGGCQFAFIPLSGALCAYQALQAPIQALSALGHHAPPGRCAPLEALQHVHRARCVSSKARTVRIHVAGHPPWTPAGEEAEGGGATETPKIHRVCV